MNSLIKKELLSAEQHLRSVIRLSSNESPYLIKNLVNSLISMEDAKFLINIKDPELPLEEDEFLV